MRTPSRAIRGFTVVSTANENVSIGVYDIRGRRVARLFEGLMGPGEHALTWNGRIEAGRTAPAGIYIVRVVTGREQRAQKLTLIP